MDAFNQEIKQAAARIADMIGEGARVEVSFTSDRFGTTGWHASAARFSANSRAHCALLGSTGYSLTGPLEALDELAEAVAAKIEEAEALAEMGVS